MSIVKGVGGVEGEGWNVKWVSVGGGGVGALWK